MKRNDFPESIGINRKMTGNDRKNERITTENDRKRPQDLPSVLPLRGMDSSEIPRFSTYFPRKFPEFPRNSLIFPDFLRYSPIFSDFLDYFS
jgi:hypothetical protein